MKHLVLHRVGVLEFVDQRHRVLRAQGASQVLAALTVQALLQLVEQVVEGQQALRRLACGHVAKDDAGAQGEHKLKRGFAPVLRYGAYCFADTPLSAAIQGYFKQELQHLQHYLQAAEVALPYKTPLE